MELYQIIATINSGMPFTMAYLPENFEGVKTSKSFSFVYPLGYDLKASVDTMRIIKSDKLAIDTAFLSTGLETNVLFDIKKLNENGTDYVHETYFTIDFESYEIFDEYSEFAVNPVSVFDYYNKIKNVERTINLTDRANANGTPYYLPKQQTFKNYVSLKSSGFYENDPTFLNAKFEQNNQSKIYNDDVSIDDTNKTHIYKIGTDSAHSIKMKASASVTITSNMNMETLWIRIKHYNGATTYTNWTLLEDIAVNSSVFSFEFSLSNIFTSNLTQDSVFDLRITATGNPGLEITGVKGDFFVDVTRDTGIQVIKGKQFIYFEKVGAILNQLFDNNIDLDAQAVNVHFTSANCITGRSQTATFKPIEFISDVCKAMGCLLNFKKDGSAEFKSISLFFDNLLQASNSIEISNYKDLSVKFSSDLMAVGVIAGVEPEKYDLYTYERDWNKKLSFSQSSRNGSEVVDLSLSKLRVDFSGMLDYFYSKSQQKATNSTDLFLFQKGIREMENGEFASDFFTPKDIILNSIKFLSFLFQNFGKNTLTLSGDGGTDDNIEIAGVAQFDDIMLSETPRLLPIEYNFTCLIGDVDFSENIIKINENGNDIYLFVVEAESTDRESEQKIRALKVQL